MRVHDGHGAGTRAMTSMRRSEDNFVESVLSSPFMWVLVQQAPLPAEPCHQPYSSYSLKFQLIVEWRESHIFALHEVPQII